MDSIASGALSAGREAFDRRDWSSAFDALREAAAEEPLGGEDLERLGEAARWSWHFAEMLDAFERAAGAYERAGDRRSAGRVALKLVSEHNQRSDSSQLMGWLGRAARLLEGDTECREYGLLLWAYARGHFQAGDLEAALELIDQIVELGARLGDRDLEAIGLLDRGHALIVGGSAAEGFELIDQAMAAAMTDDLELWTTGTVYCNTIFACRNVGDWQRAGEWSEASLRWCERNSLTGFPGLCRFHRAEVMRFRGELEQAECDALDAVEELLVTAPKFAGFAVHELGEIRRRRGDLDGAAADFRRAAELDFYPEPGLTYLRLDQGKPDAARRGIATALAEQDVIYREGHWLILPAAVEAGVAAGDLDFARSTLADLEALAESHDTTAVRASAMVGRGRIALAEDRLEDAARELRRGRAAWSEVGAAFDAAQARVLLAEVYRRLGDADAAEMELVTAHAAFERMGAARDARRTASAIAPARQAARTFMFTDIVDSTRLVELLGDESWEALLAWHDRSLRTCFENHAGEEVKHEGDGFFVAFAEPAGAIACACEIQRSLRDHRREHGFAPQVRIGVHTAEATDRGGDYGGRGVHTAARIGAAAVAGEVVASREALDAAGDGFAASDERSLELKGLAAPIGVATVDWASG